MNECKTRREFLGAGSIAVPAAVLLGGAAAADAAADTLQDRRAISGRPGASFSRAVAFDRIAFVSGVIAKKPGARGLVSPDFELQCRQVLENLKASVEAAGSNLSLVLKCGCFLTDVEDFPAFNRMFAEFFPSDPPARSTVVVKELVAAGAKLEVDCVTCLP